MRYYGRKLGDIMCEPIKYATFSKVKKTVNITYGSSSTAILTRVHNIIPAFQLRQTKG